MAKKKAAAKRKPAAKKKAKAKQPTARQRAAAVKVAQAKAAKLKKAARPKNTPATLRELADQPDPTNPRDIDQAAAGGLAVSLSKFGDLSGIVFNSRTGQLVCGHQRVGRLVEEHGAVDIQYVDDENTEEMRGWIDTPAGRFGVRVVDWSKARQNAANISANNEFIQGTWNDDALQLRLIEAQADDDDLYGELLLDQLAAPPAVAYEEHADARPNDGDDLEQYAAKYKTAAGQVWTIRGKATHRLVIGDNTHEPTRDAMLADVSADLVPYLLTDPPFCSGGFQESSKAAGSVGRREVETKVARDTLSTRGYQALMGAMFANYDICGHAYVFTDWRMWINLFDVAESSGYGVRSCIVWDKGHAGMGRGWRSQHEFILLGAKTTLPFADALATGNVQQFKRTGNKWHTTEKPVDLVERIVKTTNFGGLVVDPFAGSGTTLLAADRQAVPSHNCELEASWAGVILERCTRAGLEVATQD